MKQLVFGFYLLFSSILLDAQTKQFVLTKQPGPIFKQIVKDNYLYAFTGRNNSTCNLWRKKLLDGNIEMIDSNINYCQSIRFSDSGIFYISFKYLTNGNDGEHILNFCSYQNKSIALKSINNYVSGKYVLPNLYQTYNNKCYISSYFNGKNCLWESDGSISGTKVFYEKNEDFLQLIFFNDSVFIMQTLNGEIFLTDLNGKQRSPSLDYIPNQNKTIGIYYQKDSLFLFSYNKKLCRTINWKNIDSTSYAHVDVDSLFEIYYQNDSMLVGFGQYGNTFSSHFKSFQLKLNYPFAFNVKPIQSPELEEVFRAYPFQVNANDYIPVPYPYMPFWTFKMGFEYLKFMEDGTISFIKEIKPGFGNSIFPNYPYKQFVFNDTLYYSSNNGSTNSGYLYKTNGNHTQSLFPIFRFHQNSEKFIHQNNFYWSYNNQDSVFVYYRNLNDLDTQIAYNPNQIDTAFEWHRVSAPVSTYSPDYDFNQPNRSYKVFIDPDKNIISCGLFINVTTGKYGHLMRYSEVNKADTINGSLHVIKYDPKGKVLWSKTFGGFDDNYGNNPSFAMDNEGNIIAFGVYFKKALFDSDSLTTSRSAFVITKINGKDGSFIWQKSLNPSYYTNDNTSDRIICDDNNNIYIGFTYKNFSAQLENFQISADRSPVNAIAKLDTDGNIIFVKNTPTEWLDKAGLLRSLVFDSKTQSLYSVIGQGYYNWEASCRFAHFRSLVQRINLDGNVISSHELDGDDLNSTTCAINTNFGSLFISGFYRSNYSNGAFKVNSRKNTNGCYYNENFNAIVTLNDLFPRGLSTTDKDVFYPMDAAKDAEFIYLVGSELQKNSNSLYTLCIRKYNNFGKLIAKRYFQAPVGDPFDFNSYINIAVGDNNIVLSLNSRYGFLDFTNYIPGSDGLSVYNLIKEKDWIPVKDFNNMNPSQNVLIYPNPTTDYINLQFAEINQYQSIDFIDALGRTVKRIVLSDEIYQRINIEDLSAGVYILIFNGTQQTLKQKIVIE